MLKKPNKSLIFYYLILQFICFSANAFKDIEYQAQKLALFINNSVDEYLEQKKYHTLMLDDLAFLPTMNEGFLSLYLDLSKSIKMASRQQKGFQNYRFKGFKEIIESFYRWHSLGAPNPMEYKDYCDSLPARHECPVVDESEVTKKLKNQSLNLKSYLDSLCGCTYEELLTFSHFLVSVWQPANCQCSYSNTGISWYQFTLESFYAENLPKDWGLMRSYFAGADYNGQLSPAGLAQFSSILVFLPCPFVLSSKDFYDCFLHDFALLGVVMLKVMADGDLYIPPRFYLHDALHAISYLLSFYGYAFDECLQKTKSILQDTAGKELLNLGHHRRKIMKSMVKTIAKNKNALNSKLINNLLDDDNPFIYNEKLPHGFYRHTSAMIHSMFELMLFYLTHELTTTAGFKNQFKQMITLIGQKNEVYLINTLEKRLDNKDDLGGLLLPQLQKFAAGDKLKLYYQTFCTCRYLNARRMLTTDYNQWYEEILKSMEQIGQDFNLPKIDFSSNFFVFYHKNYSSNYNDLEEAGVRASFEEYFSSHKTHVLILPSVENFEKPKCIFIGYE